MKKKLLFGSSALGLILGAGIVGCLVTGCAATNAAEEGPIPTTTVGEAQASQAPVADTPETPRDVPKREPMEDFSMRTLDGKPWRLSDQKGKVVLLNFWATWCPPCREETPDLVALSKKYKAQGLEVVGISVDQDAAKAVPPFVKEYGIPYTVLVPKGDEPVLALAQGGIPTSVLLDRRGGVEGATTGMVSPQAMGEQIESLLKEKSR